MSDVPEDVTAKLLFDCLDLVRGLGQKADRSLELRSMSFESAELDVLFPQMLQLAHACDERRHPQADERESLRLPARPLRLGLRRGHADYGDEVALENDRKQEE